VAGLLQLGLTHTFPTAETLADAELGGLGLTRARADAIRIFARAVYDDAVRLDRSVSLDRLVSSVSQVDGLGDRTAHYLALRLGEPDACPITDLGLKHALSIPASQTAAALGELAERWRPWRALATTHLWAADVGRGRTAEQRALRGAA